MIKTILFDFGDVLVRDTAKLIRNHFYFTKLPKTKQKKFIAAFHQTETGKMPLKELYTTIHQTLMPEVPAKEVRNFMLEHSKILKPWSLVHTLSHKKYKIIIFSNNQRGWPSSMSKHLHLNMKNITFVNSALVGMHKPHENFYHYVIKKYRLDPAQTIFVDDNKANLTPAKKLGIKTFHYTHNYKKLITFLTKYQVL